MKGNRAYAVTLMVTVLVTGLALGAPRPAQANDTGAFIAGAVLGALLDNAFDRDYPSGFAFGFSSGYGPGYGYGAGYGSGYGRPGWYSWPESGVFALPQFARPYPYGHRWWEFAGTFQGRPVFVPAVSEAFGYREFVPFPSRPIFVQPQLVGQWYGPTQGWGRYGRFGDRWDAFGQYGWAPAPRMRVYRVPMGDRWYDGPDPDLWRDDRDHLRPNRPDPYDGRPFRPSAGQKGPQWDPEDSPRPNRPDPYDSRPFRPSAGQKGPQWDAQGRPGTPQGHPGASWKGEGNERGEGRPLVSKKVGSADDRGGKDDESPKPATHPKVKKGQPMTPSSMRTLTGLSKH